MKKIFALCILLFLVVVLGCAEQKKLTSDTTGETVLEEEGEELNNLEEDLNTKDVDLLDKDLQDIENYDI